MGGGGGFPGEIAGASLKHDPVEVLAREGDGGFPGEIAGASLKPFGSGPAERANAELPRRNRRGLIEAGRSRTTPGSTSTLPRRNRRGLIEAFHFCRTIPRPV